MAVVPTEHQTTSVGRVAQESSGRFLAGWSKPALSPTTWCESCPISCWWVHLGHPSLGWCWQPSLHPWLASRKNGTAWKLVLFVVYMQQIWSSGGNMCRSFPICSIGLFKHAHTHFRGGMIMFEHRVMRFVGWHHKFRNSKLEEKLGWTFHAVWTAACGCCLQ